MKKIIFSALVLTLNVIAAPRLKWSVSDSMQNPESVFYHEPTNSLFVSNVAGEGTAKDGNGTISQIGLDGKVIKAQFAKGLNAPKGIRVFKDTLWVSDIDELVGIDLATGNIKTRLKEPTAKFLNDVAVDTVGRVYVSDTLASKIFVLENGKMSVFAEGPKLESPNGLLVVGSELIVAAWGLSVDFSTKVPGRLYAMDLVSKKMRMLTNKPFANLDGLELDGNAGYIVSDWVAGKVFTVSKSGKFKELLTLTSGTADIAYIPAKKLLVIPQMKESSVLGYELN